MTELDTPGKRIRFLRESKDLTQQTLAARCYVTQPSVAHWEADRYMPNRPTQVLIAEALGTSRAFLFGDAEAVA